jgi:hypothetical protein
MNATGLVLYSTSSVGPTAIERTTLRPPEIIKNQFLKLVWQRDTFGEFLQNLVQPLVASIEIPYVKPFGVRAKGGGQQTPNMWAMYSLLLDELRSRRIPTCCFHLAQLRSLIHSRGGTKKEDTIQKAKDELGDIRINEHEADAYFIAKFGHQFWELFEYWPKNDLLPLAFDPWSEKTKAVFLGTDERKTGRQGMMWRPGDAWFDFRIPNSVELPTKWQDQLSRMLLST